MKTLLLIDAYAMIYRAYYAFIRAPRMNSRGENTSAIFGFIVTFEDLLKRLKPSHIAVAFDPAGPTFRHEAFEQYKAQRQETPEDIRWAVPRIKQILQAMNVPVLEVPGYEADDLIGTLAHKAEKEGFEVYMATPDKDYGQLVSEHIFMYRPRHTGGFEKLGPQEVCEKYGLQNQSQVIDLLGLMGDSSDNIPGCKGVGEKTAVQLLQQFGSIDNLLANTDQLKGALQRKVQEQVEDIRFSYFLATIKTDVPIDFDSQSLVYQEKNWDKLAPLYRELEFNSLLKQAPSQPNSLPSGRSGVGSKKSTKTEATLDLFASINPETTPLPLRNDTEGLPNDTSDSVEGRLVSYLLNPEVAFNPNQPINWDALKADSSLWNLYQEVELPLSAILREMEQAGVRIDVPMLKQAEIQLNEELQTLEQQIYTSASTTFNINSPKQVGEVLFDQLQLDAKAKKSKNGQYSTSEEVLLALKPKHPVVGMILAYRELKKLISTYISALPTYINPATGKIHTTYNQTVTATGRLSSSNPNLQNIPIRDEMGKEIRRAFIPDEGHVFFSADYSQIELRIMAHLSGDENMVNAFNAGEDIHTATSAKIYGVEISEVTKDMRRNAKTANFGIIYGISAFGLSERLGISRTEAKTLIEGYFKTYPQVQEYITNSINKAKENGYVETIFGRKRYLSDINSANSVVRAFAERNAVNAPIQGSAADIIKIAMVNIDRRFTQENIQSQMILQVHDELNFSVYPDEKERVLQIVIEAMESAYTMQVPLRADFGWGTNWLEAH